MSAPGTDRAKQLGIPTRLYGGWTLWGIYSTRDAARHVAVELTDRFRDDCVVHRCTEYDHAVYRRAHDHPMSPQTQGAE